MICGHPECTGSHRTNWPARKNACPAAMTRHRQVQRGAQARYEGTAAGMVTKARQNAKRRGTR